MRMQCHSSQTGRAGHGREMDQPRFNDANDRQGLPSFVLGSSRDGNDTNPVLPISRPAPIAAERERRGEAEETFLRADTTSAARTDSTVHIKRNSAAPRVKKKQERVRALPASMPFDMSLKHITEPTR